MQSASVQGRNANRAPVIEPAVIDDVAALVALVNGAYRGESSRRGWTTEEHLLDGQRTDAAEITRLLESAGNVLLVMRGQDGLDGCVLLQPKTADICYLGMLTIRPDLQARGLGRQLLAAAERHARERLGAVQIEMTVIDLRRELIAWYERRGYANSGEIRAFPYDDERFGLPKRPDLKFAVLRRQLGRIIPTAEEPLR
jgi:ribosomal protein S18 acetylase RimI-like enzyme